MREKTEPAPRKGGMMFCPECRAEYTEGVAECADCNIPLVPELPPEDEPEYVDFEQVLCTFNPADIAIIRSLLDGEGVDYFFHGEHFSRIRPLVEPARLMVAKDQVQKAKEILKDLELTYMGISAFMPPKKEVAR
ncbi:MAG: DUF2007 domain-containing protein [Candidatus Latescibacteria bacterium]|nr:DUF2007 domain-containing protein [Candidatus Latescibacterota bacterium]